jgi:hypothetical protein
VVCRVGDAPKAFMTSGIESKAGCAGVGFETSDSSTFTIGLGDSVGSALAFTPLVLGGGISFLASAGMMEARLVSNGAV